MTTPEIERLIDEAIRKRPTVTTAPQNLYMLGQKVFCGARNLMPDDAVFIAHVPPDRLKNGFGTKEWRQIVEKTAKVLGRTERLRLTERRKEQRLNHNTDMWFTRNLGRNLCRGRMVDITSEAMAFLCSVDNKHLCNGKEITTRFNVPRLKWDESLDTVSFARLCRIYRVKKVDDKINRVVVQFSRPLPFKPGEQKGLQKTPAQKPVTALNF